MTIAVVDRTGERFGHLVVLHQTKERMPTGKFKHWSEVRCDCGVEKRVETAALRSSRTASCGCDKSRYEKTRGPNSKQFTGYKGLTGKRWHEIVLRAERRGLVMTLTKEEAWNVFEKQNFKCSLTGEAIFLAPNESNRSAGTASLDRIDSSKGYTLENVQWVHKRINLMKNVLQDAEFISWCQKVTDYRKKA